MTEDRRQTQDGAVEPAATQGAAADRAAERDAAELAVEVERLRDRWLRARADLENYRKRSEQEIERRVGDVRDRLLLDWLEVVDSVDRALQVDQGRGGDEGLRAVLQQMEAVLSRHGVHRVAAKDEPFDPELHEAVGVVANQDAPDNTVADVARAGYTVDRRVLRPAQVVVSRRPQKEEPE